MAKNFDSKKNEVNIGKHGVTFASVDFFEWESALVNKDNRKDYGEVRWIGVGYIDGRLHVLVFTMRENTVRPISLRKANAREVKRYEQAT